MTTVYICNVNNLQPLNIYFGYPVVKNYPGNFAALVAAKPALGTGNPVAITWAPGQFQLLSK